MDKIDDLLLGELKYICGKTQKKVSRNLVEISEARFEEVSIGNCIQTSSKRTVKFNFYFSQKPPEAKMFWNYSKSKSC